MKIFTGMDEDKKAMCKLILRQGYRNFCEPAQGKKPSANHFTIENISKLVLNESTICLYFASKNALEKAVSLTGWESFTYKDLYLIQTEIHSERNTIRPKQYLCCYQKNHRGVIKPTYYFEWLIEEIE